MWILFFPSRFFLFCFFFFFFLIVSFYYVQILITPTNESDIGANASNFIDHANSTIEDADLHFQLKKWEFIKYVWFIFHWLAMSHCCYNPIIYCYMNARFRIGFLQMLYFIPGIRRCCCINAYTRDRSSLRTGIALTGKILIAFVSNK